MLSSSFAIFPSSVENPVATTIASALPLEAMVPAKSMFFLDASEVSFLRTSTILCTGLDSPVSDDSSTDKEASVSILQSDRKSTRLNSSHGTLSRMPSSA